MQKRNDDSSLRVALDLEVSDKQRPTKEDLEKASRGGNRKDWFKDRRCLESSNEAKRSVNNCKINGVNLANC